MKHDTILVTNVRRIIKEKGVKQYIIAEKAGIKPRELSAMLNKRKQILSVYVPALAYALDVTPNDLYGIILDQ